MMAGKLGNRFNLRKKRDDQTIIPLQLGRGELNALHLIYLAHDCPSRQRFISAPLMFWLNKQFCNILKFSILFYNYSLYIVFV